MRYFFLALLLCLPRQDDPVARLKDLAQKKGDPSQARKILVAGLQQEFKEAAVALSETRLDAMETHLIRAATLARPYAPDYTQALTQILLSVRTQARAEGVALVKACVEDLRASRNPQERITAAQKDSFLALTYKDALAALSAKVKEWQAKSPEQTSVDAEIAKWRTVAPSRVPTPCVTCKGAGEVKCGSCETGMVAVTCAMCAGKGTVDCPLCSGSGTIAHSGYVGTIRLTLSKAVTVKVVLNNGRNTNAKLPPQVLTWTLGACDGNGHFRLHTESKPLDPNVKEAPPSVVQQECKKFWGEMKNFAFTGKAKIEVPGEGGKWVTIKAEAAKRLFADYENCDHGKIPCDTCAGKKTASCSTCGGKGTRLGACPGCAGTTTKVCDACAFVGDTAWLSSLLPEVPALKEELAYHAIELRTWLEDRGKQVARSAQLRDQLDGIKRTLDPKAVVDQNSVIVPCPACKGGGGSCEHCWGTGRVQYVEGTPQFEKYALMNRLAKQLQDVTAAMRKPAPVKELKLPEEIATAKEPPKREPPKETPKEPTKFSGVGGAIKSLPADLQEAIAKADAAHEEGKTHLAKAKETKDNDTWVTESKKALSCLREAQSLYAGAQEACDEKGLPVPRELLDKFSTNMQALVMARKQAP